MCLVFCLPRGHVWAVFACFRPRIPYQRVEIAPLFDPEHESNLHAHIHHAQRQAKKRSRKRMLSLLGSIIQVSSQRKLLLVSQKHVFVGNVYICVFDVPVLTPICKECEVVISDRTIFYFFIFILHFNSLLALALFLYSLLFWKTNQSSTQRSLPGLVRL